MMTISKLTLVAAIAALSCLSGFAQTRQYDYKVSRFSELEVHDDFKVTVETGASYKVVVTAEDAYKDYISCNVKGGRLIVDLDERKVPSDIKKEFRGKDLVFRVCVTAPEALSSIVLNDKAYLEVLDVTTAGDFNLSLDNNAIARAVRVRANNVTVSSEKKSELSVRADCETFTLSSAGSSKVSAAYSCNTATLNIAGGSDATCNGTAGLVYVNAKGNSKSVCSGSADKAQFNCGGSANVDASNLDIQEAFVNMQSICNLKEAASQILHVNISGGANLFFGNDPEVKIENIKSSSMSPLSSSK